MLWIPPPKKSCQSSKTILIATKHFSPSWWHLILAGISDCFSSYCTKRHIQGKKAKSRSTDFFPRTNCFISRNFEAVQRWLWICHMFALFVLAYVSDSGWTWWWIAVYLPLCGIGCSSCLLAPVSNDEGKGNCWSYHRTAPRHCRTSIFFEAVSRWRLFHGFSKWTDFVFPENLCRNCSISFQGTEGFYDAVEKNHVFGKMGNPWFRWLGHAAHAI